MPEQEEARSRKIREGFQEEGVRGMELGVDDGVGTGIPQG